MNNRFAKALLVLALAVGSSLAHPIQAQEHKTARGESFYIIASVDQTKSQLLLKLPTEVTSILNVNPKTQYLDESGKVISLADLGTGDTVWVTTSGKSPVTATRIRKGPMMAIDLHQQYLDYAEIK